MKRTERGNEVIHAEFSICAIFGQGGIQEQAVALGTSVGGRSGAENVPDFPRLKRRGLGHMNLQMDPEENRSGSFRTWHD
jgi:hypothetical protein